MNNTGESFISEPIIPKPCTFDTSIMATGAPGLPHQFTWRKTEYVVESILETWKTVGSCRNGGDEKYVRRHWYKVRTTSGDIMTLYCDRQAPRGKSQTKNRWTLYTIATSTSDPHI